MVLWIEVNDEILVWKKGRAVKSAIYSTGRLDLQEGSYEICNSRRERISVSDPVTIILCMWDIHGLV